MPERGEKDRKEKEKKDVKEKMAALETHFLGLFLFAQRISKKKKKTPENGDSRDNPSKLSPFARVSTK